MDAWRALDGRRRTFAILAAAVALSSVLYALNIRTVFVGQHAVTAIDDIGEALAAALASAACVWAARRARGRDRLGWSLMGTSAALWAAGEVVWSIYEVGMGVTVPYPSLADAGFLSAVPFAIAGIRAFWGDARGTSARWRVWFDGLIVAIALTSTAWGFGLRAVWESNSTTMLLDLAYPVGDILIGTVLILAIRRASHQQKGRMALLLLGVASYSIADSAFTQFKQEMTRYKFFGDPIDHGADAIVEPVLQDARHVERRGMQEEVAEARLPPEHDVRRLLRGSLAFVVFDVWTERPRGSSPEQR